MRHAPKSGLIEVPGVSSGQLNDGRSMAETRSRSAGIRMRGSGEPRLLRSGKRAEMKGGPPLPLM